MKLFTNSTIRRSNPQKAFKHTVPPPSPRWAFLRSALGIFVFAFTFGSAWNVAFGQSLATNFYTVSSEDFANPERGFYIQADSYSIRPANSNAVSSAGAVLGDVWKPVTGYHRLRHTLTVNATATNASPSGMEIPMLNFSTIAETYDTWKARNFPSNPVASSPDADPDADGRVNLLEYAIGSNPNSRDSGSYLNVSFEDNALFLSFQKGPGVKDVNYEIESSPNLASASWQTSSVAILDNDASILRARYNGMAASGFLWVKITLE
jgi:hypothetical protein